MYNVPVTKASPQHRLEAMRAFVRRIVDEQHGGNVSAAARALKIPQSQVSDLLNGVRGLGLVALEKVADYAGTTVDVVIGRAAPRVKGLTKLAQHPDWPQVVHMAREQHREIEPRFFDLAGEFSVPGGAPARIDVPFVAGLAAQLRALDERALRAGEAGRPLPSGNKTTGEVSRVAPSGEQRKRG
jgi:hypothetical protein